MTQVPISVRVILLALSLLAMPLKADLIPTLQLDDQQASRLKPELLYWETSTPRPDFQPGEIIDISDLAPWQPLPKPWDAPRYNETDVWFTFAISNHSARIRTLMMAYTYARMDIFDVYILRNGKVSEYWLTGSDRPFSTRAMPNSNFVFPITITANERVNVLLRTSGRSSYLPKHLTVSDLASWQIVHEQSQLPSLIALGFMLCIIAYSAVQLTTMRNLISLCLFVYLVALSLMLIWVSGNSWYISPILVEDTRLASVSVGTAISAMIVLLTGVLGLPTSHPRLTSILKVYALLHCLFYLSYIVRSPILGIFGILLFAITLILMVSLIGFSFARSPSGRYLAACWLPIFALIAYFFLTALNKAPPISYLTEICLILHGILLMLGMSRYLIDSEKQVDKANAAMAAQSAFMARMSHEIRTPMNAVLGMADLLKDTPLQERQRSYVDTIFNAGSALLTILNDILDYAKIESGQMTLEQVELDPAQLGVDSLSIFKVSAEQNSIELICDCDNTVPELIQGDPTRLRQILVNLISNALKFTAQGQVRLQIAIVPNKRIRFAVIDSGEGLNQEEQDRLFKRFSQAHNRVVRQHGGTGLGLAICKELVQLMDGEIGIVSEKGHGSTFWFELPLLTSTNTQTLSEDPNQSPNNKQASTNKEINQDNILNGKHILLVDDNDVFLECLRAQCEYWGMSVTTANDSNNAIKALEQSSAFDVISLDWRMPEEDGITLAKRINTQQLAPKSPIILLTGVTALPDEKTLVGSGIISVEEKPVMPARLKAMFIAALTGQRNKHEVTQSNKPSYQTRVEFLVAEDNLVNQTIAHSMLEKMGHHCLCVDNGAEAVSTYQKEPERFAAILMDCEMPVLDGWSATREIRHWEQQQQREPILVVALTAHALADERARCTEAGMDDFLSKPLLFKDLSSKLTTLMDALDDR